MTLTHTVWIFDVDGVLTNPREEKHINPVFFKYFQRWLRADEPVILNTGRSSAWIEERLIIPLVRKLGSDKTIMQNFFAVCEEGATWLAFDQSGKCHQSEDETLQVSDVLRRKIRKLIAHNCSDTMFYDDTKKHMVSIEMRSGVQLATYHKDQKKLLWGLKDILTAQQLQTLALKPTVIAVDIKNRTASKSLGAKRIIAWLRNRGKPVKHFYTFGDSPADSNTAETLSKHFTNIHSVKITFVFVGKGHPWKDKEFLFAIQYYPGYDKGTLKFLAKV